MMIIEHEYSSTISRDISCVNIYRDGVLEAIKDTNLLYIMKNKTRARIIQEVITWAIVFNLTLCIHFPVMSWHWVKMAWGNHPWLTSLFVTYLGYNTWKLSCNNEIWRLDYQTKESERDHQKIKNNPSPKSNTTIPPVYDRIFW
jgi:membrane protein YdbS with pleckstrin-like domain